MDGGDVLFTGREILVGQSCRTNAKGLLAVKEAFPGYPVTGVEVAGPLHLKTLLSLCGKDTLCASTESGDSITMLQVSPTAIQVKTSTCAGLSASLELMMFTLTSTTNTY